MAEDNEILKYTGLKLSIEELEKKINFLSDHLGFSKERIEKLELDRKAQTKQIEYWGGRIEKLEVIYEQNVDRILAYSNMEKEFKELSELKASSASHTEEIKGLKEQIKHINVIYFDKKARYGYTQFYNRTHAGLRDIKEVLRDICYVHTEGPNHMNESTEENAFERILAKLGGDSESWEGIGFDPTKGFVRYKNGGDSEDTTELQTDPEWEKVRQEYFKKPPKCSDCDGYNPDYASECEDMFNGVALRCEKEKPPEQAGEDKE